MDRGCGTGTERACQGATALAAVCAQGPLHLQKACEERDLDSLNIALKGKSFVTEGDKSNASE